MQHKRHFLKAYAGLWPPPIPAYTVYARENNDNSGRSLMLNAHLPTGSRQLALSPTADWESALVGRCVPNGDPTVGANRRYSADSNFESALEPVGASR